jgi:hypothetical protein
MLASPLADAAKFAGDIETIYRRIADAQHR